MNVLFRSPMGAILARPWVDGVALTGLRRWYLPMSRLWAAANAARDDVGRFRDEIGAPLPRFWPESYLKGILRRNRAALDAAESARVAWEEGFFGTADLGDESLRQLDWRRRTAATRHLATRGLFYPLLFPRRPPTARWQIAPPRETAPELGRLTSGAGDLYAAPPGPMSVARSMAFTRNGTREYWLKGPTPSARLRQRTGSEILFARIVEPATDRPHNTLIFGSGLGLETELLTLGKDPGSHLAEMGWRVIEPISPYHGLRAMPGFYGGEPFYAAGPTAAIDLIAGQTTESASLIAWARGQFGSQVALAGISMTSFVAQQVASYCHTWPVAARPDAVLLISHSGRVEDVTFGGELAAMLGLDRALIEAGWSREGLARVSALIDPADDPGLPPSRIVSVLGETDRWVPYKDGLGLVQRWKLPAGNIFRYPLGHLGMPVQLMRDAAPFDRLRQVLAET